jgi:hypothetical protein
MRLVIQIILYQSQQTYLIRSWYAELFLVPRKKNKNRNTDQGGKLGVRWDRDQVIQSRHTKLPWVERIKISNAEKAIRVDDQKYGQGKSVGVQTRLHLTNYGLDSTGEIHNR